MPFATHILVPTDFSKASALATSAAAMLAERLGTKVTLVHVHDPDGLRPPARMAWSPEKIHDIDSHVKAEAQKQLDELRAGPLADVDDVETVVVDDASPARALCAHAEKVGADLIVIATHGRTGLKHLLIGSVAERVVRHSTVPVLTLRSSADD